MHAPSITAGLLGAATASAPLPIWTQYTGIAAVILAAIGLIVNEYRTRRAQKMQKGSLNLDTVAELNAELGRVKLDLERANIEIADLKADNFRLYRKADTDDLRRRQT